MKPCNEQAANLIVWHADTWVWKRGYYAVHMHWTIMQINFCMHGINKIAKSIDNNFVTCGHFSV